MMKTFGRALVAFGLMLVAGYIAIVALVPLPSATTWRPDDMTGTSAAARLSQEAQGLVRSKPASLQ